MTRSARRGGRNRAPSCAPSPPADLARRRRGDDHHRATSAAPITSTLSRRRGSSSAGCSTWVEAHPAPGAPRPSPARRRAGRRRTRRARAYPHGRSCPSQTGQRTPPADRALSMVRTLPPTTITARFPPYRPSLIPARCQAEEATRVGACPLFTISRQRRRPTAGNAGGHSSPPATGGRMTSSTPPSSSCRSLADSTRTTSNQTVLTHDVARGPSRPQSSCRLTLDRLSSRGYVFEAIFEPSHVGTP